MTNNLTNTPDGKFITNVSITSDRKYRQSYNVNIQYTDSFSYGRIEGNYIRTFVSNGRECTKRLITGKHLKNIAFGKEITARQFNGRIKKANK